MVSISAVESFIEEYVYHNSIYMNAVDSDRERAIKHSGHVLANRLSKYFKSEDEIPVDILAHQVVWLMQIDDTFIRADLGATYIQMSGVMVNIKDKDRSIAPYVLSALGITPDPLTGGLSQRKVGRYSGRIVGTDSSIYRG